MKKIKIIILLVLVAVILTSLFRTLSNDVETIDSLENKIIKDVILPGYSFSKEPMYFFITEKNELYGNYKAVSFYFSNLTRLIKEPEENDEVYIKIMDNVKLANFSGNHCLIVDNNNKLWGSGLNSNNQIKDGEEEILREQVEIMDGINKAVAIYEYSVALNDNKELFVWGNVGEQQYNLPIKVFDNVDEVYPTVFGVLVKKDDSLQLYNFESKELDIVANDVLQASLSKISFGDSFYVKNDNSLWIYQKKYGTVKLADDVKKIKTSSVLNKDRLNTDLSLVFKNDESLWFLQHDDMIFIKDNIKAADINNYYLITCDTDNNIEIKWHEKNSD